MARRPAWALLLALACGPARPDGAGESTGAPPTSDPSTSTSAPGPTTGVVTGEPPATATGGSTGAATTGEPPTGTCRGDLLLQIPELTAPSGLERCPDGQVHRPAATACAHPFAVEPCPGPDPCDGAACDELGAGACHRLADQVCHCRYPCTSDADCQPDAACLCASGLPLDADVYDVYVPTSECVPADCRSDADCGDFLCALSPGLCGYATVRGLFCHTAADECTVDADCDDPDLGHLCLFDLEQARWRCTAQVPCE